MFNYLVKNLHFIFISIFIILLNYIFYKSEIYWDGSKREYYLIFYFVAFSFLFFSLIIFYLNNKIKEYLLIILISIFIAIYVFEIYLTLSDKPLTLERFEKTIKLTNEQNLEENFFIKKTGKNFDKELVWKYMKT